LQLTQLGQYPVRIVVVFCKNHVEFTTFLCGRCIKSGDIFTIVKHKALLGTSLVVQLPHLARAGQADNIRFFTNWSTHKELHSSSVRL